MSGKNKNKGGWWERSSSWFSGYSSWSRDFYKQDTTRPEVVKPYMSWYEYDRISRLVRKENSDFWNKVSGRSHDGTTLKNHVDSNNNIDHVQLTIAKELFDKVITKDLVHDIYSLYYNKSERIVFDDENDSNKVKFKILESINNSLLKITSNENSVASLIYTKEICNWLFTELWNNLNDQEKNDLKQAMQNMNTEKQNQKDKKEGDSEGKGKGKGKSGGKGKSSSSGGDSDEDNDNDEDEDSGGDSSDDQDEDQGDGESSGEGESKDENKNEKDGNKGKNNKGEGDESESSDGEGQSSEGDYEDDQKGLKDSNKNQNSQKGKKGDGNAPREKDGGSKAKDTQGKSENVDRNKVKEWREQREKELRAEAEGNKEKTKNDKLSESLQNMFSKKEVQQRFDKALSGADKLMIDMEKAGLNIDKDDLQAMADILNMSNIRSDIAALAINKNAIAEAIKHILDDSVNYFSKRYKTKEIEFFEADEIPEIYGIEYIHPVFRSGMLDRLSTVERKPIGKIDLYVDVSGSMGSNSGIPGVTNMMFAKAIALAMLNIELLNNLYIFDTSVRQVPATELGILGISYGGGTSIDAVTNYVKNKAKGNGICLTDGECSVSVYDDRLFMLGTIGVLFNYFYGSKEGQQFLENSQCINFDGKNVTKIAFDKAKKGSYSYRGW